MACESGREERKASRAITSKLQWKRPDVTRLRVLITEVVDEPGAGGQGRVSSDEHQFRAQEVRDPRSTLPPCWRRTDSTAFTARQWMRTGDPGDEALTLRRSQGNSPFQDAFPSFQVLFCQHESPYFPVWELSVRLLRTEVLLAGCRSEWGVLPMPTTPHTSLRTSLQGLGSPTTNRTNTQLSRCRYQEAQWRMNREAMTGSREKHTFRDPFSGNWQQARWAKLQTWNFIHVLMMGVVGKARKYRNFSNTENSKHFLLWVLETRNGSLSFEVRKQRDQKNVYSVY